MISNNEILKNIAELETVNSIRLQKYRRNLRKYLATPGLNIDTLTSNSASGRYSAQVSGSAENCKLFSALVALPVTCDIIKKIKLKKVGPMYNHLLEK